MMRTSADVEKAVRELFDRLADVYGRKDLDGFMALFWPDADLLVIGTGRDEWRVGPHEVREQALRDFSQSESLAVDLGDLHICGRGDVAWVACPLLMRATVQGERLNLDMRLTAVVTHQEGAWRIAQFHASVPAAEQEEGSSF